VGAVDGAGAEAQLQEVTVGLVVTGLIVSLIVFNCYLLYGGIRSSRGFLNGIDCAKQKRQSVTIEDPMVYSSFPLRS